MYRRSVRWGGEPISAPTAAQVRKRILKVLLLLSPSQMLCFQSLFSGISGCARLRLVTCECERWSQTGNLHPPKWGDSGDFQRAVGEQRQ